MNVSGAVILLSSVALLVIIGVMVMADLHSEVDTKDSTIKQQADTAVAIEKPLLMVFSYGCIIVGTYCAINTYSKL